MPCSVLRLNDGYFCNSSFTFFVSRIIAINVIICSCKVDTSGIAEPSAINSIISSTHLSTSGRPGLCLDASFGNCKIPNFIFLS